MFQAILAAYDARERGVSLPFISAQFRNFWCGNHKRDMESVMFGTTSGNDVAAALAHFAKNCTERHLDADSLSQRRKIFGVRLLHEKKCRNTGCEWNKTPIRHRELSAIIEITQDVR